MAFIFVSEFLESSALCLWLKLIEHQKVKVHVTDKNYRKILKGLLDDNDRVEEIVSLFGHNHIWVTDDASSGKLADGLRERGEVVFGGSVTSDKMENDRQFGQSVMKGAGIPTVPSINFKGKDAFDKAIEHIQKNPKQWVIKQNGDQDKSLSTVGKFDNGEDVIDKLNDMKHIITSGIDFDLQERVEGHEVAIEGWFNGKNWVSDTKGEPVFIINFEHKKMDGDTGRTTGETCTLAYRLRKEAPITRELTKMTEYLRKIKYIGNCDINFMLSTKDKKFYGLEFTNRFGYPSLNLHQEMLKSTWSELLEGCAKGQDKFLEYDPRWAVVVVVQAPPFPFGSKSSADNAKGQRIYFTDHGKWSGKDALTLSKLRHTHLYEVELEKETKHYLCTGDTGYLATVTAQADTIEKANSQALQFLKDNIYTKDMHYRKDCGINPRVTAGVKFLHDNKLM